MKNERQPEQGISTGRVERFLVHLLFSQSAYQYLRAICFEPDDGNLADKLQDEVRRSVAQWLPYINVQEVNTLTDAVDKNQVFVTITYSTTLNADTLESITLDAGYTATTY